MSDIVEQLRDWAVCIGRKQSPLSVSISTAFYAANTIESLRQQLAEKNAEIERLKSSWQAVTIESAIMKKLVARDVEPVAYLNPTTCAVIHSSRKWADRGNEFTAKLYTETQLLASQQKAVEQVDTEPEPVAWKDTCLTIDEPEHHTEPVLLGYIGWESLPDGTNLYTEAQLIARTTTSCKSLCKLMQKPTTTRWRWAASSMVCWV